MLARQKQKRKNNCKYNKHCTGIVHRPLRQPLVLHHAIPEKKNTVVNYSTVQYTTNLHQNRLKKTKMG